MSISASTSTKPVATVSLIPSGHASKNTSSSAFSTILATQSNSSVQASASSSAPASGGTSSEGLTIAGKFYTAQQIHDFYAGGGNDYMFVQAHGLRDQNFIHNLLLEARAMGGGPVGEEAMQRQFEQYQANNPKGVNANNYAGFVADQPVRIAAAIRAGTYTGAATSPSDFEPGGIYAGQNISFIQNGLDANGMSDRWIPFIGWAEGASAPTAKPTAVASTQSRYSKIA